MDTRDINEVLKNYDHLIRKAAEKFPIEDQEDAAQEIRIWLFGALEDYEDYAEEYAIYSFVRNHIGFCLRRLFYDVKMQDRFERGEVVPESREKDEQGRYISKSYQIIRSEEDEINSCLDYLHAQQDQKRFNYLLDQILQKLNPREDSVFFAMLFNHSNLKYRDLAKKINMEYNSFRNTVIRVQKAVKSVLNSK